VEDYAGLIFPVLLILLILMLLNRTRRQQRVMASVQASIQPGLWAMTTSGLHGKVISAGDEPTVVLEIAPGVHTRWARLAIAEVFDTDPAVPATEASIVDLTTESSDPAHGDATPDDRDDRTLT
jgi:preprotein translocase subunit YajC